MVIWTVDGDGGREYRMDVFSVYLKDKFIVGLGDGVCLMGKEGSRMAPKYLAYMLLVGCCYSLRSEAQEDRTRCLRRQEDHKSC